MDICVAASKLLCTYLFVLELQRLYFCKIYCITTFLRIQTRIFCVRRYDIRTVSKGSHSVGKLSERTLTNGILSIRTFRITTFSVMSLNKGHF